MPPRPRTALVLNWDNFPGPALLELARDAETMGYDTLWVGETWARDAFSVLTQLALTTSRVKLGTSVISIFSRSAAMLAQSAATLQEVSNGRAVLGLGPSSRTLVENWHGQSFDRPIARMRELVPLLRRILSGERVEFEGEFHRMSGLTLPVVNETPIPIYLASLSPLHLRLTGEMADGWLPTFFSLQHLDLLLAPMEQGAKAAGRARSDVTLAPWVLTCVSDDPEQARALAREHIAFFVAAYGDAYQKQVRRYGFVEEADRLVALWKSDRKRLTSGVSDAMLDALAVTGSRAQCRERFEELHERGIELPAVLVPARAPLDVVLETTRALAPLA